MASLFIANTSNKHHDFSYRLPGVQQLRWVNIPAGKQVQVLKDAQREEIDCIIEQHKPYGLVHSSEAKKIDAITGLIYTIDSPVKPDQMESVREKNEEFLVKDGHELRKMSALAINQSLDDRLEDSGVSAEKNSFQVEVVEIEDEASASKNKKLMKEKIKVAKD